ncbi:MAG: signal transduction histidine kinase [Phenylobacterium sp.]
MLETDNPLTLTETLADHLEIAIALADPSTNLIVQYNAKFAQRCLDVDSKNDQNTDIDITTIMPSLKIGLLHKVLGRNRKHRHIETFTKHTTAYPVDFVFSNVELSNQPYILIQGTDNAHSLELENIVHSYDQLIKAQTLEITLEKQKSQIASRVKSQFLSRMSHELRTPMNAILGFAQIQTFKLDSHPTLKQNNDHILTAGYSLLALIEKMFDFVEMEDHILNLAVEQCDLHHCIEEALSTCVALAQQYNVQLCYQPSEQLANVSVKTDKRRFIEIIKELLTNGIKFNNAGGAVTILVSQSSNDSIKIAFKDTGTNITFDEQQMLFEPFFRSEYADHAAIPGIGMGLVLSQKIAKMMNGSLHFKPNQTNDSGDGFDHSEGLTFFLRVKQWRGG